MKDELEALLEEEEALEAELAQVLAHRTFYYYKKKENMPEKPTGQNSVMQAGEKEFLRAWKWMTGETMPEARIRETVEKDAGEEETREAENPEAMPMDLYRPLTVVAGKGFPVRKKNEALAPERQPRKRLLSEETVYPALAGGGGAEALYVGLIRARQAAGYRRPVVGQRLPLTKEPGGFAVSGLDAAGVDQIFQRDARRYDGGFTWQ